MRTDLDSELILTKWASCVSHSNTRISIVDIWAAISKFQPDLCLSAQLQLPHLHLLHPPSLVVCHWNSSGYPVRCLGVAETCRPACNCIRTAMYTNCYRLPTRFSIVQCCAQRGLVLCQRGAKIVPTRCQDCANEVPRLCSVVPVGLVLCKAVWCNASWSTSSMQIWQARSILQTQPLLLYTPATKGPDRKASRSVRSAIWVMLLITCPGTSSSAFAMQIPWLAFL
jgi:hypothetical protein